MKPVIKIENLSKQYRLGTIGTGTISNDLKRWWYNTRGKEDPFLKIGESNDRSTKGNSEYVWALRDINLEVMPGEVLGIIGKNGAGKSTLLKILSKVTGPTTGSISFNGRIGSLLEVGTGFHPELTGRENIYLNGAILGMTKAEIKNKLDEIIDFSGCQRYIDTPVKRYSSGMTVRLGFSVAAHLEPEILVVDEVLAVGDAEFQKKAIGKMQDVSSNDGRTVLFVSHNMGSIKQLCTSSILLKNGSISYQGGNEETISEYFSLDNINSNLSIKWDDTEAPGNDEIKLQMVSIYNTNHNSIKTLRVTEDITLQINYKIIQPLKNFRFTFRLKTSYDDVVFANTSHKYTWDIQPEGTYVAFCTIPKNLLHSITYKVYISADIPGMKSLLRKDCLSFTPEQENTHGSNFPETWPGIVCPVLKWKINKI